MIIFYASSVLIFIRAEVNGQALVLRLVGGRVDVKLTHLLNGVISMIESEFHLKLVQTQVTKVCLFGQQVDNFCSSHDYIIQEFCRGLRR